MFDRNPRFHQNMPMKITAGQSTSVMARIVLLVLGLVLLPATGWAQVSVGLVGVGDAGNAADTTGYGSVGYNYSIGTYEVLNSQYAAFLTAVAAADTYNLYNVSMATDARGGILQSGISGAYTYSVKSGYANMPVVFVSYYDALRFANWMQNGQPTGAQGVGTTETGTYTFAGETVVGGRNSFTTPFYALASENEWYKAAYYDQSLNAGSGGYWLYPTRSGAIPGSRTPPSAVANSANFSRDDGIANGFNGGYAVTQSTVFNNGVNYLSAGGAYSLASSYYGTFDQGGNATEWSDAGAAGVIRGGSWATLEGRLRNTIRQPLASGTETYDLSFRIAFIPEPSAVGLISAGFVVLLLGRRFLRR